MKIEYARVSPLTSCKLYLKRLYIISIIIQTKYERTVAVNLFIHIRKRLTPTTVIVAY